MRTISARFTGPDAPLTNESIKQAVSHPADPPPTIAILIGPPKVTQAAAALERSSAFNAQKGAIVEGNSPFEAAGVLRPDQRIRQEIEIADSVVANQVADNSVDAEDHLNGGVLSRPNL